MFNAELGTETELPVLSTVSDQSPGGPDLDLTIVRTDAAAVPADIDATPITASPERRGSGSRELSVAEPAGGLATGILLAAEGDPRQEPISGEQEVTPEADDAGPVPGGGGIDTPVDPPDEAASPAPDELPDPREIASRVSGVGPEPDSDDARREVEFDVMRDIDAGTATIRVRDISASTIENAAGETVPLWTRETSAPIGHYDPEVGRWKLYPEYVRPHEEAALAGAMEANAAAAAERLQARSSETGEPFVDLRDPVTRAARQEVGEYMPASLITELPQRRGGRQFFDGASSATCVIRSAGPGPHGVDQGEELVITYRGLGQGSAPGGPAIRRNDVSYSVAYRNAGSDRWRPTGFVDDPEWALLSGVPEILKRYAREYPDFSPADCAIRRGTTA